MYNSMRSIHPDYSLSMTPSALGPSLPDIDAPSRMSLDPVGTPRRTASGSSYANTLNLHPRVGRSRFLSGSISEDDVHIASLWARYAQVQESDAAKNALLEEVLTRYTYLQQTHNQYLAASEQEVMSKLGPVELSRTKADVARLVEMLQLDPFALVLIDGDIMFFDDHLLRLGEEGGKLAAGQLNNAVTDWMKDNIESYTSDCQIVTRVYANVKAMAETCFRTGVVPSPSVVEDFVRGFTRSGDLFDIIDVSFGGDSALIKINAMLKLHIRGYQCRHVLIGCTETDGYAHMLGRYLRDRNALQDMTLLGAKPFEYGLAPLPIKKITMPTLFRENKAGSHGIEAQGDATRLRHDSRSNFNPHSGVFTPASQTPVPVIPLYNQRHVGGRTTSPAVSSMLDSMARSNSIASSSMVSEAPASSTVTKAVPAPPNAWSSIAQRSAHLPFKDLTRPPPEPKMSGPVVRQNKHEQRLDPHMDYDHERVFELKKLKLCNQHYIGRGCCHWEAGNGACPHKHDYPLSTKDKKWLRVVARETVGKKGTYCVDFECIYGHHCPYPKAHEGSMRGIGCINGDACRFGRDMHGMDMTVAKVLQPKDFE